MTEHETLIEGEGNGSRNHRWVCSCSDRGEWVPTVRIARHDANEHRFLATKRDTWAEVVRVILVEEGSVCEHTNEDGPTIVVDVDRVSGIIAARLVERWDQG